MTIKHLYPSQRPSLDLNFARTKRLDPRVTFTRGSTATYVGNDGLIKYAAADEARFDHDPETGESLGLLIEESRTNLFDYSVDVSQWDGTNWTATPNSITAPDGTLTGGKVVPIVGTTFQTIGRSITWTSGVTYSVSFFAKDAGMGGVQVQCFGQINRGEFDLVNGTSSIRTTGLSTSITPFPNGWYKCVYIFTAGSNSTGNAGLRMPFGFTPDGVNGIYAWGFQVEALAFPTSYIPTSGSTVTRAADVASITGNNFTSWYNQSEGSLFSQYIPTAGYGQVKFWNGNANNLNYWSTGPYSTAGGVFGFLTRSNQGSNTGTFNRGGIEDSTNYGYVIKHAAAIADNDFACYTSSSSGDVNLNTGSPIPATGEYLTPLVDRLILNDNLTGVIHLARLTYYPTRLSDTILQNLTL